MYASTSIHFIATSGYLCSTGVGEFNFSKKRGVNFYSKPNVPAYYLSAVTIFSNLRVFGFKVLAFNV
jgi:hypothetical protein